MGRYTFDRDRAVFSVSTRPGVGLGVTVVGASGHIDMQLDERDAVDLAAPVTGAFRVTIGNIHTANKLVTAAALQFFGTDDAVIVQGAIDGATRHAGRGDRLDLAMTISARDADVPVVGTARVTRRPNGDLEATGDTMVDPRAFHLPVPPLVTLMIHTRWRVVLDPPT